ncbi:unnamed protein product [Clavelina lepadiformis]|uniref:PH domain-containing protein n=1 Tax=Clavelina lepadiformis TaxID=159417 RepID=A0ABP0F389_CLALP
MSEFLRLKSNFEATEKAHEEAAARLARVSKKKANEKSWQEATDHLYATRKAYHNTYMLYCCCLNDMQRKKKIGVLKPVLNYLQSQISFFEMGSELEKRQLQGVLEQLSPTLKQIETDVVENRELLVEKMDRLDAQSTRAYIPDPPLSLDFPDLPVDCARTQISGYLFCRSKSTILTQWNRAYFFTQGGNLMYQTKKDLAGRLFMDLDSSIVCAVDKDDRRNVFQITSADKKKIVFLQGESKQQCEEWIATVKNISSGLYLADDPRKALKDSQAAQHISNYEVVEKTSVQVPASENVKGVSSNVPSKKGSASQNRLETEHDSFFPSVLGRLKQAASLITLETHSTSRKKETNEPCVSSGANNVVEQSLDENLDMILNTEEPVLFELPSYNLTEDSEQKSDGNENSPNADENDKQSNGDTSMFEATFVVRFLGCKHVGGDYDWDSKILDTIWEVMAARALHKFFRMNEFHLVISNASLRLVDPTSQMTRVTFPISCVLCTKTHADNCHLLGFIGSGGNDLMCYVFESNADGNDVCCAINTANAMEQSKVEYKETEKQQQIETDLKEQSRIITTMAVQAPEPETQYLENDTSGHEASENKKT